jgi:TPR repeat protein
MFRRYSVWFNPGKAISYFKKASDLGSVNASFYLGIMFHKGKHNIPVNVRNAETFYRRAATKKHIPSLGDLFYMNKDVVDENLHKAIQFYEAAAKAESVVAMSMLGYIYCLSSSPINIEKGKMTAERYCFFAICIIAEQYEDQNEPEQALELYCRGMRYVDNISTNQPIRRGASGCQYKVGEIHVNSRNFA